MYIKAILQASTLNKIEYCSNSKFLSEERKSKRKTLDIITGGLGGLGQVIMNWQVWQEKMHILLVSRSGRSCSSSAVSVPNCIMFNR